MIASALSSTPPITRLLNPNAELWLDTGVVHHHYWGKLLLLADSDSADGHLQLGNLASSRNLRDTALAHFTRALRLRPANATGHLRLAQELTERGAYEAARRHLREAERCDPRVRYLPEFQSAVAAASK